MILPATGPVIIIELSEEVLPSTTVDSWVTTSPLPFRRESVKADGDTSEPCMVESVLESDYVLEGEGFGALRRRW